MSGNAFPWWEDTITIYNRYEDPLTNIVRWYRNVIEGCFWKYDGVKISINTTVLEGNTIICRIPENDKFLEKYQWDALSNDQQANYFTLGIGDIIVHGKVNDVVDEYINHHRASDLLAKYKALQGCMEIQNVSINTGTAKCVPHYLVRGE